MSTAVALVEKIKQCQEAAGLNESEFARKLGMSRANWFLIKKGQRGLSNDFLSAVMGAFPELTLDILDYMRSKAPAAEAAKI
jgi:transcriptional regulator with XRE-family HTH domain